MRVLLLGGSGTFGSAAARRLAAAELVSEIGIAGRNEDALARVASDIGDKARTVPFDICDENRLSSLLPAYDLVVNAAGPEWEVLLPALKAAIAAGTHYCDIGAVGRTTERQLELDSAAKDRNVVAVVGIDFDPGLDNLQAVHASRQLDSVAEIQLRHHWFGPEYLSDALEVFRKTGRVDMSVHGIFRLMNEPVPVYRDGRWVSVNALENPVDIPLSEDKTARALPLGTSEVVTLPRFLSSVRTLSTVLVVDPPQLYGLFLREAERMAREGLAPINGAKSFLKRIGEDPDRWLKRAEGVPPPPGWSVSVAAIGRKDGRTARYTCWPNGLPSSTVIPLTVATLRILRGEISARGVLPPESCFEPTSFFEEAAAYGEAADRGKPLLGERFEWLDLK